MRVANDQGTPPSETPAEPPVQRRVAFERLRERTDELELIISGISLVALVAMPGWLFDQWVRLDVHAGGQRGVFVSFALPVAIGLCYTLAGAFLIHLIARAYWVGLIGLKSVFPRGIRWERIDSLGPITRERMRQLLNDLDPAIDAADRFASVVFALVSLIALTILWVTAWLLAAIVVADAVSRVFGVSDRTTGKFIIGLFLVLAAISLPLMMLDRAAGLMHRAGREAPAWMVRSVNVLSRMQGWFFPQKLILPVQLVLESNLPRRVFSIAFGLIVMFTSAIGFVQMRAAREFSVIGDYPYSTEEDVGLGVRTAHYENLRGADDVLLREPLIPSDLVADPFVRLFIPYLPERDNRILRDRCSGDVDGAQRRACLAGLWTVTLDGVAVDVSTFDFAERRDLGTRGLQGYLPTGGLTPGRHEIVLLWNAGGESSDRHRRERAYHIPFWFAPPYQLDYSPPAPTAAPASAVPDTD
ncbi:MAG: hypothetical protein J0L88_02485 [Xanthomonadales bacterium]|nr:hypothetical protein [Xanthomonadales bacterium]